MIPDGPRASGGDGGRGDISLLKREVSPHAPQRETRGDFDFPPDPLETTQRGGAAAPPLWIPLPGMDGGARSEAGSAERGAEPMRQPPRKDAPKAPNAGNTFPVPGRYGAPGGSMASFCRMDSHDSRTCPNLPEWAGFGHKAPFLLTVNGRFLFGATEKKMGVHSRTAKRCIPPSRPRGPAFPTAPGRPRAAQRHIVPRLTARRPCPYPHLLHF